MPTPIHAVYTQHSCLPGAHLRVPVRARFLSWSPLGRFKVRRRPSGPPARPPGRPLAGRRPNLFVLFVGFWLLNGRNGGSAVVYVYVLCPPLSYGSTCHLSLYMHGCGLTHTPVRVVKQEV